MLEGMEGEDRIILIDLITKLGSARVTLAVPAIRGSMDLKIREGLTNLV